mgnify:CR=1 FL=1
MLIGQIISKIYYDFLRLTLNILIMMPYSLMKQKIIVIHLFLYQEKNFTITLRVGKDNIDSAYICYGCCYVKMQKNHSTDFFDYYEGTFICDSEPMNYYFQIICDGRTYFYNKAGVIKDINSEYNFTILPDFSTPSWAKGAVMYQIYVDRFYNGDKSNDVVTNEYEYLGLKSNTLKTGTLL